MSHHYLLSNQGETILDCGTSKRGSIMVSKCSAASYESQTMGGGCALLMTHNTCISVTRGVSYTLMLIVMWQFFAKVECLLCSILLCCI